MFVLHPSSRCDVCLETFSSEGDMVPFAIPCGHVFCKTCLDTVQPPKCPMCRKNFDPTRMKKLHVDLPEGLDDPREADLLQRVITSFEASADIRQALIAEVDAYLADRAEDLSEPLRKGREALDKYHELREMGIRGKRDVAILKRHMREKEETVKADKERSVAVEKGLLARAEELQTLLVSAQGEIEHLRAEIQRRTQLKNPLPAPPQPISLDRYAGFGQANGSQAWFNDNGRSMLPPGRTQTSLGVSYVHPRNLYGDDDRENHARVLSDANGVKRDRKGKSRERQDNTTSVYGSVPPPFLPPHETSKPKVGIIPGAGPKSKFVPPDPDAELERGLHAFKPPDHEARLNAQHRLFDSARDITDPYSVIAATLPEYVNGFAEGWSKGYQGLSRPLASTSGTRDSDPDLGDSGSDRERRDRRRRRREEEKERERRERDPDRERREHRSRRERPRDGEKASVSHRTRPDAGGEDSGSSSYPPSSSRSHRDGEHRTSSRSHRGDRNHAAETSVSLAMLSDDPPQRRRTISRSQASGSVLSQPTPMQPTPQPATVQQHPMRSTSTAPPLAQPTPRIPVQIQRLESLEESAADEMPTPASRHSIQSISTVESWGTVSSLAPPSPNSFISLNLRALPRQAPMPMNDAPYESPARPSIPAVPTVSEPPGENTSGEEDSEDEDDDDEDTEVEEDPIRQPQYTPAFPSAPVRDSSRPATRSNERSYASAEGSSFHEQPWGSHPVSAPVQASGHGSRHTQAISIPEPLQVSPMPYPPPHQPPPSVIHSASAAIPDAYSRHSRNHSSSSRRDAHQHRSRHSASQVPTTSSERASGHRQRRTSLASVPSLNQASLSSLSLGSITSSSNAPPASAPVTGNQWDSDGGYHTDVPSSGNALGLAVSTADRDYTIRNRTGGALPISQPKPMPAGQLNFLRSLSRDNYGSED